MKWMRLLVVLAGIVCGWLSIAFAAEVGTNPIPAAGLSPGALIVSPDGRLLYLACVTANRVIVVDASTRKAVREFLVPDPPSGLALSANGAQLVATCSSPQSKVCVIDVASGRITQTLAAGHTALSPVLARDGKTLYVCNRFNDTVSIYDLKDNRELASVTVAREPISAVLTPDEKFLLVANHLPKGRSDLPYVAAGISVIDIASRKVVAELHLPNGSINLRQLTVSPDGKFACVPHSVARFQLPVTQIDRGWVNTSALTIIDLGTMSVLNTVLLDEADRGAANPWATAWSEDGRWLGVTHAGTHELSLIDFPALVRRLRALSLDSPPEAKSSDVSSRCVKDAPNDLSFLSGLRRRIPLKGNGPRGVAMIKSRAFVSGYFSDSLESVPMEPETVASELLSLNPGSTLSRLRRGEMYFNDAAMSFQGWQSCASCHDDDARVDALNWDLLNDGIGNPKDTKSLVLSYQTPPVMSLGVRATADIAVRSGILNSLATVLPEDVPVAMGEWLKSLKPMPSPRLVNGHLSEGALRGEKLFRTAETGCSTCHEPLLFTDLHSYDVGTANAYDKQDKEFDTPTLRELWRTAPYLHDGSAATVRDVLTLRNPKDGHGKVSHLGPGQIDDLVEYLLSL